MLAVSTLRTSAARQQTTLQVLPPGEFTGMIIEPMTVYSESMMMKKISQTQLRSITRELIPFWRFEQARVDTINLAYDLRWPNGRLHLQPAPLTNYRPVCP